MINILFATGKYFGLSQATLMKKTKCRGVVYPRQIAMYLMCKKWSYADISRLFGMNHATVMHAEKTIKNLLSYDNETRDNVSLISQEAQTHKQMKDIDELAEQTYSKIALAVYMNDDIEGEDQKDLIISVVTNALLKAYNSGLQYALGEIERGCRKP